MLPVTVYDQHGFRVLFHFARDPLPGRSDVLVVVVSMLSTAPQPIRNIVFQSAVPKVTRACSLLSRQGDLGWMGGSCPLSLLGEPGGRREPKDRAPGHQGRKWQVGWAWFLRDGNEKPRLAVPCPALLSAGHEGEAAAALGHGAAGL